MPTRHLVHSSSAAAWPVDLPQEFRGEIAMEFHHCAVRTLTDIEFVRVALLRAAEVSGATVETDNFHRFEPAGICGTVLVAEGHFSVQCFPQRHEVAVHVFTSEPLRLADARSALIQSFQSH